MEDADFRKTKKTIFKQVVGIRVVLDAKEYHADVYYNPKTGERVHAAFPEGVVNDVNYDGSIKAFLFLLNNDCCVPIDKCRKFLSDLTGGKLNISKGMINKLTKEFAKKTENEQKELYHSLLCSPVMHTDCTNARENGKNVYVYVCTAPDGRVMYFHTALFKGNHLLFLHDIRVPANNNQAERCLRNYKRKQKQAMSFRSFESLDHLCRSMSMLVEMRKNETNVFDKVSMIFG